VTCPDEAGTGLTPARPAKAASDRNRPADQHLAGADWSHPRQLQQPGRHRPYQPTDLAFQLVRVDSQDLDPSGSRAQLADGHAVLQRLGRPITQGSATSDLTVGAAPSELAPGLEPGTCCLQDRWGLAVKKQIVRWASQLPGQCVNDRLRRSLRSSGYGPYRPPGPSPTPSPTRRALPPCRRARRRAGPLRGGEVSDRPRPRRTAASRAGTGPGSRPRVIALLLQSRTASRRWPLPPRSQRPLPPPRYAAGRAGRLRAARAGHPGRQRPARQRVRPPRQGPPRLHAQGDPASASPRTSAPGRCCGSGGRPWPSGPIWRPATTSCGTPGARNAPRRPIGRSPHWRHGRA
jgi:hypothetical protein